jgi:hypothetical protein
MHEHVVFISRAYDLVIRKSLLAQVIVGLLAAFVLDGGMLARVVGVAVLAFWLCVALIIMRRPHEPTKFDLAFVLWGFWPVLGIAVLRQLLA